LVKFATLEYYNGLAEALNKDEIFTKSGISTTMIYHVIDRKAEDGQDLAFFMKFEKGKVVEVRKAAPNEDAEFIYRAKYDDLVKIVKGELDAQAAMKSGQLKFKYFLFKAIRYKGALERLGQVAKGMVVDY